MNDNLYFIETMTTDLAKRVLADGKAADIQSALDMVYNSAIYDKMCDERTRLMYQNPGYVYRMLNDENKYNVKPLTTLTTNQTVH